MGRQKPKKHLQIIEHWRVPEYWFKPFYTQIHLQQPVLNQSSHHRDEQLFEGKNNENISSFLELIIKKGNRRYFKGIKCPKYNKARAIRFVGAVVLTKESTLKFDEFGSKLGTDVRK